MTSRALVMGINEYESISNLRGCHNDVYNISNLLIDVFGFEKENVVELFDEKVTKKKLKKKFYSLLDKSREGDEIVFHFSGHGSYIKSDNNDEPVDELICLYDMEFGNKTTFMTDDEIGELLGEVPDGVKITVILDCCHSGSGTRAIQPDGSSRNIPNSRSSLLLVDSATRRSLHEEYARFATPPPRFNPSVSQLRAHFNRKNTQRSESTMNHLLFASASDEQTAADAFISGDYNGAFSYYFCEAARELGSGNSAKAIFDSVFQKIKAVPYSQTPQLEGIGKNDHLFINGGSGDPGTEGSNYKPLNTAEGLYQAMMAAANHYLQGSTGASDLTHAQRSSDDIWVAVHGISQHKPGYSTEWYLAMSPYLHASLEIKEVIWSHHVNPRNVPEYDVSVTEIEVLKAEIRATLEERAAENDDIATNSASRDLIRGDGLAIDDFIRYMTSGRTRERIISEFINVVKPLLHAGKRVHITSHSWGTVVAYEGLRRMESESSGLSGQVANFFVVGSALSIGTVRRNLFSRVNDGRKPDIVKRWYNLDAKRDIVGGKLSKKFKVDQQYLKLEPVGCSFLGLSCAHSSYFNAENLRSNRDIFAEHINETLNIRSVSGMHNTRSDESVQRFHAQIRGIQEQIDDLLETAFLPFQDKPIRRSLDSRDVDGNPRLAVVVGHTASSGGAIATSPLLQSEYQWNSELAEMIKSEGEAKDVDVKIFLRDGIGISGAYRNVANWGADAAIELHFNAFNGQVRGTETLYGTACDDSKRWAELVQDCMVSALKREGNQNRGLRECPPYGRGSHNVNALIDIPSCLIEPFFGDNFADVELIDRKKSLFVKGIVDLFLKYV